MRQGHKDRQMMGEGTGTVYRIVVRSELSDRYALAFEGMKMEIKDGETILTGEVIDQPHLFGILDRINGLGLELLSVHALPEDAHLSAERNREPKAMRTGRWEAARVRQGLFTGVRGTWKGISAKSAGGLRSWAADILMCVASAALRGER
jgi:hypothetical protein